MAKGDRILDIKPVEESFSQGAEVLLDNTDGALTALDLKGYEAVISFGATTSSGDEYSAEAPLLVRNQRLYSSSGQLVCSLTCIGIPNRLAEDKANDNYDQNFGSEKTVKDLITEIADGQPVTDNNWGEAQNDSDSFYDLYTGGAGDGLTIGQKLITSPGRTITALEFYLKKTGSPTGNLTFTVQKVSDESTLLTGTLAVSGVGTSAAWHRVTFGTPVLANIPVYLFCKHLTGSNSSNYVQIAYNSSDVKAGENLVKVPGAGISGEDCAYRYYYQNAGIAVFDHTKSWTVTYDSEDSLIDSYAPADALFIREGESRLNVIDKLLQYTGCERMFKADGNIHILVPTISGATWLVNTAYLVNDYVQPTSPNNDFTYRCTTAGTSHAATEPTWPTTAGGTVSDGTVTWTAVGFDYEYALTTGHTFFSKALQITLVIPNKIVVKSFADDVDQYTGNATSAVSFALIPISGSPIRTKLTSNAQATSIAEAYISRLEVASQRGNAFVPMNVGAEQWDYVKVTDEREDDFRIGNIGYLGRSYIPGLNHMTFGFGGVAVKGVPGTQLSQLNAAIAEIKSPEVVRASDIIPILEGLSASMTIVYQILKDILVRLDFLELP